MSKVYKSKSAQQAQASGYGKESYWDYLEEAAQNHHDYYTQRGMTDTAELMFTQSLGECLQGNDGD